MLTMTSDMMLAFGFPGMPEMLIVLFLALLLFGGAKLPGLMRNLGKSANEFKRGMSESLDDDDEDQPSGDRDNGKA